MNLLFGAMIVLSLIFGLATGRLAEVSAAAVQGAGQGVTLSISLLGVLCLWSGVMEALRQTGAAAALARLLRPTLRRLFPRGSRDQEFMEQLSANVSANLLGLGNAATPYGIAAAGRLAADPEASRELGRLVVLNASSIQLLPATVAGVRATLGAGSPFDIVPAVLLTSAAALTVGLAVCRLLERGQ